MFLNLIPLWKKLFKTKLSHPYVPFVKSVSFALSVSIVLSATSVPLVKSVPSIPSVPIVTSVSLVTSVPSAQNLPIVTSVPSAQNVPLVKSEPSIPSVPIVTSVPSAQNVKPKIKTYADVVSSRVNQNDLSSRYDTKTGSNNGISSKYLASFNIFLKRKNDLEVEVNNLLSSAKNDQIQPSH